MEAVHIGDHLQELLEERGITEPEFVNKMGIAENISKSLLKGKEHVTEELAKILEDVFSIPHTFWLGLQKLYDKN